MDNEDSDNQNLGSAVLVGGCLVAWFSNPEQAVDWARENYFGQWLTWRAKIPEIVPLSEKEIEECKKRAEELMSGIKIE